MNILLRPWREADAAACAVLADDEGVAANLRDVFPHPYAEQDARDFIALCLAADPDEMLSCVVEVDGAFAGSVSLTRVYKRGKLLDSEMYALVQEGSA